MCGKAKSGPKFPSNRFSEILELCAPNWVTNNSRAFHFYLESMEMLSVFIFAAKRSDQVMPPDRALLSLRKILRPVP